MKIKQIDLYKVEIPMVSSFTTSFGTVKEKPTVIIKITTDDGIIGFGEAAALPFPYYKPDTTDICVLVLKDYISPLVLNKGFKDVEELMMILKTIKNHNFAKTGLENAVWMAMSIKENRNLKDLLGGTQERIAVGESIGIKDSIEETLEEIELRIKQGFRRIKIKIKPGWDIEVVKSIREKFGDIDLMVDANSSYTLDDLETLRTLDAFNLTMTEQPLADNDIVDHATLQKQIKTPICLDESIHSKEDARKAIEINACRIINIKPGRVGGLLESKKIHDVCKQRNVGVWCGGMLETGIGRAFNIAVASLPNYIYPADMSPVNFFYKDDLVDDSFIVDSEGFVAVPKTVGLGFKINEKKIEKYKTAHLKLT
ncbi:MAG: o-succinylbenzoate synthase [Candidatus Levybacteria bacterium]|nr:o-succinylbenzoate synthase [Candidatus Levybacteria bacterium]